MVLLMVTTSKQIKVMLNLQNSEFKTVEQLRSIAPSIFTQHGSGNTSEKYSHIPTDRVIRDMEVLGWGVVDAKQVKSPKKCGLSKTLSSVPKQ
jgi:hypothetical protein